MYDVCHLYAIYCLANSLGTIGKLLEGFVGLQIKSGVTLGVMTLEALLVPHLGRSYLSGLLFE